MPLIHLVKFRCPHAPAESEGSLPTGFLSVRGKSCYFEQRIGRASLGALLLLISLALFSGGVAAGIGYINLGALVVVGIAYTLALLGLALVVSQFFSDLFDGLDEGRYRWQKAVRRSIGLKDGDYVPGLGWLRLVVNLALWIAAALLRLRPPRPSITCNTPRNGLTRLIA